MSLHPATLIREFAASRDWPYDTEITLIGLRVSWCVKFPQQFSAYTGPGFCDIPEGEQAVQFAQLAAVLTSVHANVCTEHERISWVEQVAAAVEQRILDPKFRLYLAAWRQKDGDSPTYYDMTIEQSQRWLERINAYTP